MLPQRVESARPLRSVRLEPGVELHKWFGAEPVQASLGVAADLHQSGVTQHLQVARHARLVHPDRLDQLTDGALTAAHGIEEPPTGRLCDDVEDGKRGHPVRVRYCIYMCKHI